MPGNKRNVRRFNLIDTHVDFTGTATIPETIEDDLPAAFKRAGLLAPEGFTIARDEESTNVSAYGVDGLVEAIEKFNGETWNAIFLEDNDVVGELLYSGSTTGDGAIPVPVSKQVVTCFTLENTATGYKERWFTVGGSKWRVNGDRSTPDSDIRRTPLICSVFAEDPSEEYPEGRLYQRQRTSASAGGGGAQQQSTGGGTQGLAGALDGDED